ncbi:uncharacterized protein BO95DRAFT_36618 [Aspergillus brunneoviolaceus CBS 621.78]|uniref:Uncharacterized protein n=1 Tax=Aspergillus brunneoviolaceus CBS 621.78 TaxID=1450534 RepID=A0ACD1FS93_9EURO|nr:hypothetical protein BO95DRAFT_36618 [Aspergillus brunneoviolaceus CBS 621.78]RAH39851.1 hypothetical protein BO95DRAFT_36618 [Aspergillus brunneoviolaceus CBS 621.78]
MAESQVLVESFIIKVRVTALSLRLIEESLFFIIAHSSLHLFSCYTLMPLEHHGSCGFLRCPAEILNLVFGMLSTAELRALGLVNKDLCALVEPYLYSKIDWIWRENHAPPPITLLLRTIISRPQLAAHITSFQFQSLPAYCWEWNKFAGQKISVPVAELDGFITFVQRTGAPYSDLWIDGLSNGTPDAMLALLLAQLWNLRSLSLDYIFCQQTKMIEMLFQSAICEPAMYRLPDFKHLQTVSFQSYDDSGALCTALRSRGQRLLGQSLVLPFFYLPDVQRISAAIQNTDNFAWPTACLPDPSKLTSIYLADIREANLGSLLSVTRNLQSRRWTWYYDYGVLDATVVPIINLDGIVAALSRVRNTLADLTIFAEAPIGGDDPCYPAVKVEGSLREMVEFGKLKRLQIPLAFLVGFAQDTTKRLQDVLPRNIEYLSLTDELGLQNEDGYVEETWPVYEWQDFAVLILLRTWLEDWRTHTPHLRGVSLVYEELDTNQGEWPPELRHQLTELGTQAGIQLELVEWVRRW